MLVVVEVSPPDSSGCQNCPYGRIYRRFRQGAAEGSPIPKLGSVKLFKQIKIKGSWKLAPALFDTKGRVRRDHVCVQDKDELHAQGNSAMADRAAAC